MALKSRLTTSSQPRLPKWLAVRQVWLDVAVLLAWGVLLLKYWLTGQINVLLHPDYVWLAIAGGIALVVMGSARLGQGIRAARARKLGTLSEMPHISLFPSRWSSGLLLTAALIGLWFTPRPFSSQVALERGVTDTLTMTRSQPQAFRSSVSPEEKSLIDWVRTLNVYPEPDAYTGQPAKVDGFVIHPPEFPDNYLLISRFVITCCAADVYPVGLPVKLTEARSNYPPDAWFRVEGDMITETLAERRQLVINAKSLTAIEAPKNPYEY